MHVEKWKYWGKGDIGELKVQLVTRWIGWQAHLGPLLEPPNFVGGSIKLDEPKA